MSHARTPGSDIANGSLASSPARRRLAPGDLEDDGSIGCADVSTACGIRDRSPFRSCGRDDPTITVPLDPKNPHTRPGSPIYIFSHARAYRRRRRSNQAARKVRQTHRYDDGDRRSSHSSGSWLLNREAGRSELGVALVASGETSHFSASSGTSEPFGSTLIRPS